MFESLDSVHTYTRSRGAKERKERAGREGDFLIWLAPILLFYTHAQVLVSLYPSAYAYTLHLRFAQAKVYPALIDASACLSVSPYTQSMRPARTLDALLLPASARMCMSYSLFSFLPNRLSVTCVQKHQCERRHMYTNDNLQVHRQSACVHVCFYFGWSGISVAHCQKPCFCSPPEGQCATNS